jgi:hypothetical protein
MKFIYPVYNPHQSVLDAAKDWGIENTTEDLASVLAQPYRVAAVRVMFDEPSIYNYDPAAASLDLTQFDLVLISDAEYLRCTDIIQWINRKGIRNWLLAKGGQDPSDPEDDRILYRPFWLDRFLEVNQYQDTRVAHKPFLFDSLMGARRPHRDYVMLAATQSGLAQSSIINYRTGFFGDVIDGQTREFKEIFPETGLNWPYVSPNLDPSWEVASSVDNTISFISPVEIYRRCRYTIVTETLGTGDQFFFSEKSMKVLFNQRVFVMFGNAFFLQRLRDLGFETFGNIIDETYDSNLIDKERFKLAMQQVHVLSWENPDHVYELARPALEHNHHHMSQLLRNSRQEMHRMISQCVPAQYLST